MAVVAARVAGALAGQAVGDALGAPAEGLSAYDVIRRFQKIDDYFGGQGKFSTATRAGFMNLSAFLSKGASEESVVWAHEQLIQKNLTDEWLGGLNPHGRVVATGTSPEIGKYEPDLIPVMKRGDQASVGVELVAKLCPLGSWAASKGLSDNDLLALCKLVALPTHAFRPAILSAWVAAKIVKEVSVNHDAYSRSDDLYDRDGSLLCQVIEFCRKVEEKMTPEENAAGSISERLMYARARLQARCRMVEFASLNGHSRDVFEMTSFSVFCFMSRPEEFRSVVEAVGLGGRSSVRGAVIGAMIGAFAGAREIPPNLVRDVEGSNRILAMARGLTDG